MIPNPSENNNAAGDTQQPADSSTPSDTSQTGETHTGSAPEPLSLDDLIEQAANSIGADWSPTRLEEHLRTLCHVLVERRASGVITSAAYDTLRQRLAALKRSPIGKGVWNALLKTAAGTTAVNNPPCSSASEGETLRTPVRAVLPTAPVPDTTVVPPGWKLMPAGVVRAGSKMDMLIVPTPLVITARLRDDDQQTESVRIAWYRDGHWREHVCERSTIAVARSITDLADYGLPVTSLTAADLVAYLAEYEQANIRVLPRIQVRMRMGWVDEELSGFLWGRQLIRAGEPAPKTDTPPLLVSPFDLPFASDAASDEVGTSGNEPAEPASGEVYFQGADAGDEQIADGYRARGILGDWKETVEPMLKYPVARLAVLASLGTPLLSLLADEGARNFTIDISGDTSKGKTTILRAAASVWGSPREDGRAPVLTSWSTTVVGAERRAGLMNGLPILRDDTKLARKPEDVSRLIYEVSEGRTRDRGTVNGLSRTSTFSTVMQISGESRAVSLSGDGGTRARVLTLCGMPFGKADEETARLVENLNAGVLNHYGHAGPTVVHFLLANRERWQEWRARYRDIKEKYAQKAKGDSVAGRLADAFALIDLAGEVAAEALEMSQLAESPIGPLRAALTAEAGEADRALEALKFVYDWASSHPDDFFGGGNVCHRLDGRREQPPQGWVGHWSRPASRGGEWQFIGFIPGRLRAILFEGGYDYDAVVSTWKDRHWLRIDGSSPSSKCHQVVIEHEKPRVVAVTREAFRAAGCVRDGESDELYELREVARWFLNAVQNPSPQHGDPEALANAVRAVQAWRATLVGARGAEGGAVAG